MNFKNKILLITLLALLSLLFLFNSYVLGSSSDLNVISYNEDIVSALESLEEYQSGEYWYIIFDNINNITLCLYPKEDNPDLKLYISAESTISRSGRYGYTNTFNYTGTRPGIAYYYDSANKVFNYGGEANWGNYSYNYALADSNDICYTTNLTVYTDDSYSTVFFRPVTGVVIPALETAEQIPEAIAKTLKILIPVGLVVLSVGLLIYLIKRTIHS